MATLSIDIWKSGIKLGSGTATSSSASVTSWTATSDLPPIKFRNVQIAVTQAGTHNGRNWNTTVLNDNGSGTLTLEDACPFL